MWTEIKQDPPPQKMVVRTAGFINEQRIPTGQLFRKEKSEGDKVRNQWYDRHGREDNNEPTHWYQTFSTRN